MLGIEKEQITHRSKMALNLTRKNNVSLCSSNRLADTTANGVLTFCDRASGLELLYSENEVVYFNDTTDLIDKIRHYAINDSACRKIAEAGWKRAHDSCSAQAIVRFMIGATYRSAAFTNIPWPKYILCDGAKIEWELNNGDLLQSRICQNTINIDH